MVDWNALRTELEQALCKATKQVAVRHKLVDDLRIDLTVDDPHVRRTVDPDGKRVNVHVRGSVDLPAESDPDAVTLPTEERVRELMRQGYNEVTIALPKSGALGPALSPEYAEPRIEKHFGFPKEHAICRSSTGLDCETHEVRDLSRPSDLVRRLQVRDLTKAIIGMPLYDYDGHAIAVVVDVDIEVQRFRVRWQADYSWYEEFGEEFSFDRIAQDNEAFYLTEEWARVIDRANAAPDQSRRDPELRPLREEDWEQLGKDAWWPVLHNADGAQVAQAVQRNVYQHMPDRRYVILERIGDRWGFNLRGTPISHHSMCEIPLDELLEAGLRVRPRQGEQLAPRGGVARLAAPALKQRQWLPTANLEAQRRWVEDHVDVGYGASAVIPKPDVKVDLRVDVEEFSRTQELVNDQIQKYLDEAAKHWFLAEDLLKACTVHDEVIVRAQPQSSSSQPDCVCSHGGLNGCPGYRGKGRCVSLPEDDE